MSQIAQSDEVVQTQVSSSVAIAVALSASDVRSAASFYNDSNATVCLGYESGSVPVSGNFVKKLIAAEYWEMPQPIYPGIVYVQWPAAGSGKLMAGEYRDTE